MSRRYDLSSPPELADLTATERGDNELNQSEWDFNSNSESSLTIEDSKIRLHQFDISAKDCVTAWTDEKHNLYLDHLESSFIEQLHQSVLKCSADSRVVRESHHSHRCARKLCIIRATKLQDSSAASNMFKGGKEIYFNDSGIRSHQIRPRHGKSFDCIEEFSDQNFADKASEHICVTTMSKRSKTISEHIRSLNQRSSR